MACIRANKSDFQADFLLNENVRSYSAMKPPKTEKEMVAQGMRAMLYKFTFYSYLCSRQAVTAAESHCDYILLIAPFSSRFGLGNKRYLQSGQLSREQTLREPPLRRHHYST